MLRQDFFLKNVSMHRAIEERKPDHYCVLSLRQCFSDAQGFFWFNGCFPLQGLLREPCPTTGRPSSWAPLTTWPWWTWAGFTAPWGRTKRLKCGTRGEDLGWETGGFLLPLYGLSLLKSFCCADPSVRAWGFLPSFSICLKLDLAIFWECLERQCGLRQCWFPWTIPKPPEWTLLLLAGGCSDDKVGGMGAGCITTAPTMLRVVAPQLSTKLLAPLGILALPSSVPAVRLWLLVCSRMGWVEVFLPSVWHIDLSSHSPGFITANHPTPAAGSRALWRWLHLRGLEELLLWGLSSLPRTWNGGFLGTDGWCRAFVPHPSTSPCSSTLLLTPPWSIPFSQTPGHWRYPGRRRSCPRWGLCITTRGDTKRRCRFTGKRQRCSLQTRTSGWHWWAWGQGSACRGAAATGAAQHVTEGWAFQTLHNVALLQAQVLAMMGRTKEAEKMTNHILNEDLACLECYRLLSAIYSKQELYAKVPWHGIPLSQGLTHRAQVEFHTPPLWGHGACLSTHSVDYFFTKTFSLSTY